MGSDGIGSVYARVKDLYERERERKRERERERENGALFL